MDQSKNNVTLSICETRIAYSIITCLLLTLFGCSSVSDSVSQSHSSVSAMSPLINNTASNSAADWTVMIYMNAKNNLEPFAINNFKEIAETGSSKSVNYIVEMGRPDPQAEWDDRYGNWSGVYRFRVTKDLDPTVNNGDYVGSHKEIDMGAPSTLTKFIKWAKATYPAQNYALIIWNHGQGFRLQVRQDGTTQVSRVSSVDARANVAKAPSFKPANYRSVSSDDDTGSILYNIDVRNAIAEAFNPGELKIIGFDACSMAMIETAYEMRNLAPLMVASEELEPGPGWQYGRFVPQLSAKPTMTPVEFGSVIVDAYKDGYRNTDTTTLSLIDLTKVDIAADRLSDVGNHLASKLPQSIESITAARSNVGSYKPVYTQTTVDSITVLNALRSKLFSDEKLVGKIDAAIDALQDTIVTNYASTLRQDEWGSKGIAVFFPLNESAFHQDPDNGGYRLDNNFKPISFVHDKEWSKFIAKYSNLSSGP